jgi:uncharacterized membrane protein (GlpM family)
LIIVPLAPTFALIVASTPAGSSGNVETVVSAPETTVST